MKLSKAKYILFFIVLCLCFLQSIQAKNTIRNIYFERKEVFEKSDKDWFFAAPFLNSMHILTKEYVIKDELIFKSGDVINEDDFLETERNLNSLGLFTSVKIEIEEIDDNSFDIYVETKDRWSFYPAIMLGASGGEYRLGGRLKDYNLFGHGIMLNVDGEYIFRSDTNGYQWNVELEKNRLFRTEINTKLNFYNSFLTQKQNVLFEKPFRTLNTTTAYGANISNSIGDDYFVNRNFYLFKDSIVQSLYPEIDSMKFIHSNEQKAKIWFAKGWEGRNSKDKVYFSSVLEWQQANREKHIFDRAYDNQSKFILGFSSVGQNFYTINNANAYHYEDLVIGGWGCVALGAVFPSNERGEKGFFYIGGQMEKSYYTKNFYLFLQVTASSSFLEDFAKYTYQEFLGLSFIKLSEKFLLAARIREQASWNYPRMRQLMLDDQHGVRGYNLQGLAGDNRLITNLELRYFPNFQISVMQFSAVAFFDAGSVWNQKVADAFFKAQIHSSVGLGFRGHFTKSNNPDHLFRCDFPYNLRTRQFGISLGVQQYFSAFSNHTFKLPAIYSEEFDY